MCIRDRYKGKLKYKPKALEEVIFIEKDKPYSDFSRALTYRYISNLRNFKYPSITFKPVGNTSDLEANIFLSLKKGFQWVLIWIFPIQIFKILGFL